MRPDPSAEAISRHSALDRLSWPPILFASRLNRFALMKLGAALPVGGTLHVFRNHAFEGVASALAPFLDYAGVPLRPEIGAYDDSLALPNGPMDAAVVWMDFSRYPRLQDDELVAWLIGRLDGLRSQTTGPIVVANSPDSDTRSRRVNEELQAWCDRTPAAAILPLDATAERIGAQAFDDARAALTGTRLSDQTCLEAARSLVLEGLAGRYAPPVKAVAVDLDHTLYEGVLGEDGPEGVVLTEGHRRLQEELAGLAARGVLLTVLSRNEPEDVEKLFSARADFPLRPDMISDWQVGWGRKSDGILKSAKRFNIGPDSFLLLDDNIGELVETAAAIPGLRQLHAGADPALTARALARQPGLAGAGAAFAGRASDLQANVQRLELVEAFEDDNAYLEALQVELRFELNPKDRLGRLAELSRKTNQFNLSLRRLDEVAVSRYLNDADQGAVHISLADRLADSGSVAAVFVRREDGRLIVDELCVSCRALGRRLEDVMIASACIGAAQLLGATEIVFDYRAGPRNQPALDWLAAFAHVSGMGAEGRVVVPLSVLEATPARPVTMSWIDA